MLNSKIIFYSILIHEISTLEGDQTTNNSVSEESGRTILTDWIIGILMMAISLACAIAYYTILTTIFKDKELMRMASYRFMFVLGIFDIAQCLPHFVTGIFTIFQNVFDPVLAKFMGVIATPCYVAYAVLTIFLSFNRLIQLSSSSLDQFFFAGKRWLIWIGIATFFWLIFVIALSSPWATIRYIPDWYSWDYDYELIYSKPVQLFEMYIEVGSIFISMFFYILIIFQLLKTKKRFLISSSYNAEIKVLIQATVITLYCTILNVLWHNYETFLPSNIWSYTALNFMWIFNSGVYPIIYFIVNKALRDRISVRKSGAASEVSMFRKSKIEQNGIKHTATAIE